MSSNNNGSENPEDLLKKIQVQKTHNLYCSNCTHNVTQSDKLFKKEDVTFPYNKETFRLGFVIVLSFKYPFVKFSWLCNKTPEVDIVKSIVYGGLIESITSFGVVFSAAAFGTSTLNVLALGLANLFSGLFLIIFNLYGLVMSTKFYQSANIDHMTVLKEGKTDPYKELLGNKDYYILHCVVVVVSFLFFGMIPPFFYALSFKITDKGHYEEAAVVVAASLVCVISLSFAKAYAFGLDKLKTVAVYTGIAIGAFALSFIASQHARDMFEK